MEVSAETTCVPIYYFTCKNFNMVKRQSRPQINSVSLNLTGTAEMSGTLKQDTIDAMVT